MRGEWDVARVAGRRDSGTGSELGSGECPARALAIVMSRGDSSLVMNSAAASARSAPERRTPRTYGSRRGFGSQPTTPLPRHP
jgi:hypothetical protein